MLRFCTAVMACLALCLGFARADSDVTITIRNGEVKFIDVPNAPDDFNVVRDLGKFTVDGKKVTEEQLAALVWRGDQFRICDKADYVALFTVWKDKDGTTYYKHGDGVYRLAKPTSYDDVGCDCGPGCKCQPHKSGTPWPDANNCGGFNCPANGGKPAAFFDIYGNVYTLGPDGNYRQMYPTSPPQGGCPNGRCPNR